MDPDYGREDPRGPERIRRLNRVASSTQASFETPIDLLTTKTFSHVSSRTSVPEASYFGDHAHLLSGDISSSYLSISQADRDHSSYLGPPSIRLSDIDPTLEDFRYDYPTHIQGLDPGDALPSRESPDATAPRRPKRLKILQRQCESPEDQVSAHLGIRDNHINADDRTRASTYDATYTEDRLNNTADAPWDPLELELNTQIYNNTVNGSPLVDESPSAFNSSSTDSPTAYYNTTDNGSALHPGTFQAFGFSAYLPGYSFAPVPDSSSSSPTIQHDTEISEIHSDVLRKNAFVHGFDLVPVDPWCVWNGLAALVEAWKLQSMPGTPPSLADLIAILQSQWMLSMRTRFNLLYTENLSSRHLALVLLNYSQQFGQSIYLGVSLPAYQGLPYAIDLPTDTEVAWRGVRLWIHHELRQDEGGHEHSHYSAVCPRPAPLPARTTDSSVPNESHNSGNSRSLQGSSTEHLNTSEPNSKSVKCDLRSCGRAFSNVKDRQRHQWSAKQHPESSLSFACPQCSTRINARIDNWERHLKQKHNWLHAAARAVSNRLLDFARQHPEADVVGIDARDAAHVVHTRPSA